MGTSTSFATFRAPPPVAIWLQWRRSGPHGGAEGVGPVPGWRRRSRSVLFSLNGGDGEAGEAEEGGRGAADEQLERAVEERRSVHSSIVGTPARSFNVRRPWAGFKVQGSRFKVGKQDRALSPALDLEP